MKPSARVLDANLERLLTRSWKPAKPSAAFVAHLEQTLAPWIAAQSSAPAALESIFGRERARRPVLWIAGALAAAALVLLIAQLGTKGVRPFDGGGPVEPVLSLEELLQRGEVALCSQAQGAWRAASPDELERGLLHDGGYLAAATPASRSLTLRGAAGWSTELRATSVMEVQPLEAGLVVSLKMGDALFSNGGFARLGSAPLRLTWRDGDFFDEVGLSWSALAPAARSEAEPAREELRPADPFEGAQEQPAPLDPQLATLEGRVVFAHEREPATNFEVTLLREVALPQVAFPFSRSFESADGSFRWEGLEPGTYSVFVSGESSAIWKTTSHELVAGASVDVQVELELGGTLKGFVMDAKSGAAIDGALVLSEDDMPLQAIAVERELLPSAARAFAISRQDGSFEIQHANLGSHRLRASAANFAPAWLDTQLVTSMQDGLNFELTAGGAVEGLCEHSDGKPFQGAQVIVSKFSAGTVGSKMSFGGAHTDERGGYRVEHLAPGFYVALFFAASAEAPRFQPSYKPVMVLEGQTVRADFLGEKRGASITGVVRDAAGAPLPFANLQLWSLGAAGMEWLGDTADETGHYEFRGLDAGPYRVYAGTAESMSIMGEVELAEGASEQLDVTLQGHGLAVRLRDAETSDSIAFIDLFLVDRGASSQEQYVVAHAFSKTSGIVRFENLKAGEYDLFAVPEQGPNAWAIRSAIRIDANREAPQIDLLLERACAHSVQVVDAAERPLAGASIQITSPSGETWDFPWTSLSSENGELRFERLRPGDWTYRVRLSGYRDALGVLSLESGTEQRSRIQLLPE